MQRALSKSFLLFFLLFAFLGGLNASATAYLPHENELLSQLTAESADSDSAGEDLEYHPVILILADRYGYDATCVVVILTCDPKKWAYTVFSVRTTPARVVD